MLSKHGRRRTYFPYTAPLDFPKSLPKSLPTQGLAVTLLAVAQGLAVGAPSWRTRPPGWTFFEAGFQLDENILNHGFNSGE